MKLLSEAFDTVKRVYAYEKSVKVDRWRVRAYEEAYDMG